MSRDKEEEGAWGRLAGLEAGSSGGGRICPAAARTAAPSMLAENRGLQTYRTSRRWASYSAATDGSRGGLEKFDVESPGTLLVPGWDTSKRWQKERQSWADDGDG